MNAIIALCHFCDHHGPTTLFCTQAFKYSDYTLINSNSLEDNLGILLESAPPDTQSPKFNENENKILNSNLSLSPNTSLNTTTTSNCKACRAFDKNFHHYISYDNTSSLPNSPNQICYLSQSNPNDSEVFALVRKACLRTLHCEVFEDPIYFDDDKNGSVIGYEFNIKDIEGRGVQRSYSLIIIMKDRIYLQHLWSFLSHQMSIIANNLKQEAEKKFQKDLNEKGLSPSAAQSCGSQFLNYKKTSKQVRGLIELTDDPLIFAKLHMWFTWILRMSSCQISEEFMHGPLSEDLQVKCEREKLKELAMDKNDCTDSFGNNLLMIKNDCHYTQMNFYFNQESSSESLLNKSLNMNEFLCSHLKIESLKHLFKLIGQEKFHQIAYNVMIGNQVIIRGKYERLVESIIRLLEELIPLGCCKSVYFSVQYLKSYECKLLGISDRVNLFKSPNDQMNNQKYVPDDLNEFILVDILVDSKLKSQNPNLNKSFENNEDLENLIDYKIKFEISSNVSEITQVPSILTKMESYLVNDSLDDKSIGSLIRLAKEEWINKTKVFYKYLQSPNVKSSINIKTVLNMLDLTSNDELALKYWQAGLSQECKMQIRAS
ncbi:unnamed protein product [Brachionus calyciflorus]|uniref:Folliculin n=1 Tax=Brachionus calyciflorus TaxID=104777 RepID=A0A813N385_9BILA|nr:unnamed protein product [Brachionus calyciflorus]